MAVEFTQSLQKMAVSLLLQDSRLLERYRDIFSADLFIYPVYKNLVKFSLEYFDVFGLPPSKPALTSIVEYECLKEGAPPDLVNFQQDHLSACTEVFAPLDYASAQYITQHLGGIIKQRRALQASMKVSTLIGQEKYDEIEAIIGEAANFTITDESDIGMSWRKMAYLDEFIQGSKYIPVPTGYPLLDASMQGGVRPEQLNVIVAASGSGKSMFLVNLASNALAMGKKVVFISLEMSQLDLMRRLVACQTGIDFWNLEQPGIKPQAVWNLEGIMNQFPNAELLMQFYPMKGLTARQISSYLKRVAATGHIPELLIIDYGDLLKAPEKYTSRYDELGSIFDDLKWLAQTWKIPIWTATQGNRSSMMAKKVGLQNVAESVRKIFVSDSIYCLCQDEDERARQVFRLKGQKVRNHGSGTEFYYTTDFKCSRIREINWGSYTDILNASKSIDTSVANAAYKGDLGIGAAS